MASTIYTRTGDKGTTALADGSRISKTSTRIEAYGTVDEANSWIGAGRAFVEDPLLDSTLEFLQHRFYNCSSNLATPRDAGMDPPGIEQEDVDFLESAIDRFERDTGAIGNFIIPGGCTAAGLLHVARTLCRRAERRIIALAEDEEVDALVRKFVNRSSDFLFAAARYANLVCGGQDIFWKKDLKRPEL